MRAAVVQGPGSFEVRDVPTPTPDADEVVVRVRNCGICGSDLHSYRGHFPMITGSIMGHEIAGEVAAVGSGVRGLSEGDRVAVEPLVICGRCAFCRSGNYQHCGSRTFIGMMMPGGFAEYVKTPGSMLYRVADRVPFETAALVEPLAVAVHGLRLVKLEGGERVCVLGAGTIGLVTALAALAMGASQVSITARYDHQRSAAEAIGAAAVDPADTGSMFGGTQPDVVVETVGGDADTINQAVQLARPGGRVAVLGLFMRQVGINMGLTLMKEVTIVGGITYNRPGLQSDFDLAVDIAARQTGPLGGIVTHRVGLDQLDEGFATAANKKTGSIKVTVEP